MPSAPPNAALNDALLIGCASGLRTFSTPAALALGGRFGPGRARRILPVLAAIELVWDKHPKTPARTMPSGLAARAVSGGTGGALRGGTQAAAVGAAVSVVAAYGGQHTRRWLGRRTGAPDAAIAVVEDALALGLAYAGTRAIRAL